MLGMDARSFSHLILNLHTLQISMFQPDRVSQDFPRNVIYSQCSLPPIYLKKQTNKEPRFIFFFWSFKFTDRKRAKLTSYISRMQLINNR